MIASLWMFFSISPEKADAPCLEGRLEVVESLLDRGADIHQTTEVRDYRVIYTLYMYC
jgi:hypothetical protein